MALVATVSRVLKNTDGTKKVIGTLAFDSSYPTNGEDYSSTLGNDVMSLQIHSFSGYTFHPDYANKKIKVYVGDNDNAGDAPGAEVANTTNLAALSAVPFEATVYRI